MSDAHSYCASLTNAIDHFTDVTGRWISWLSIVMMIVVSLVVLLRYGLNIGSIALQEAANYLHASLFMLGAAYTLKQGQHVRVDIFYRRFSTLTRAWVDSVGAIVLLLPTMLFIAFASCSFVSESWAVREGSSDPGGLPFVYLLKSLIPAMAILLSVQALAEVLRNLERLMRSAKGDCDD
ncbi:TRAP-type mannitol/chloroaromatic compound transport system permease small subunit [Sinobacterium caligoides]|uniref:TRAP transporter small permease protein n=1 Tax=Sinobacterium caligoides TaxID=933926 RepID=A0A3N2DH15_9GAMM|nr:TRAP transporter small permease subunit [Sinobacterium caligoides]ROR99072.1 TRAP-type mannitol/chloroaromatic compound transport system permease small subunit [Sinobacterium caligoides]